MALSILVKGGGNHFATDGAAHFGYFFGTFVNQEDDEFDFGIVCGNGVGNVLQHHGFTAFGRGNQEGALTFADGEIRSMARPVRFSSDFKSRSSFNCSVGNSGVRFSNRILWRHTSGWSPLMVSSLTRAK